jgi:hypothetical protein
MSDTVDETDIGSISAEAISALRTARCRLAELTRFYEHHQGTSHSADFHGAMSQIDSVLAKIEER